MSEFFEDLQNLGFRRVAARRGDEWTQQATPYLTYSIHMQDDGQVIFTWELAIGELMSDRDLQIGSNETLNIFLFPKNDARGPAETDFVVGEMERVTRTLTGMDLTGA